MGFNLLILKCKVCATIFVPVIFAGRCDSQYPIHFVALLDLNRSADCHQPPRRKRLPIAVSGAFLHLGH
jgi:hypothetical protein